VMFQANPALKRRLFGVLRVLGRADESAPQRADADTNTDATTYGDAAAQEPLPPQPAPVAHALALVVALVQAWSFRRGARAVSARPRSCAARLRRRCGRALREALPRRCGCSCEPACVR